MSMSTEKERRILSNSSVSTLVNDKILEENRYYIISLAEIIQFLAINELALRGRYNIDKQEEYSLFKNLFEYTLRKDHKLANCVKHIPEVATYLSPEVQNEIIEVLSEVVREEIVHDIKNADVPWFTLLEDGTKDKNGNENIAIGIRFVKDGKPRECLLKVMYSVKLDARSFTDLTLNCLKENNLDCSHLLSQCYDGASVMSGAYGGVQALIQQDLNRHVPYVHCYDHRLHLVVTKTISSNASIRNYFEQCELLHNLFHSIIRTVYKGRAISRLLEQRWQGHLRSQLQYSAIIKKYLTL